MALLPPSHPESKFALRANQHYLLACYRLNSIAIAHLVTDAPGGRGAARQAVEAILRAQDRWEQAVEGYLRSLAERDRARRTPAE